LYPQTFFTLVFKNLGWWRSVSVVLGVTGLV